MWKLDIRKTAPVDVLVCGGGIAGVSAAVAAARRGVRVRLIEPCGGLGGTLTEGMVGQIMDLDRKGGIIREIMERLTALDATCPRVGPHFDENGKRVPGRLVDTAESKFVLDELCREAGVEVWFYSRAAALDMDGERIASVLIATECGNYTVSPKLVIDATGNGSIAALAENRWDCGDPEQHRPSPAGLEVVVNDMPEGSQTDTFEQKTAYGELLAAAGAQLSATQAMAIQLPGEKLWGIGFNMQFGVTPEDIGIMSDATMDAREEIHRVLKAQRTIPELSHVIGVSTAAHLGIREGRRIYGKYRLTDEDILCGRKFEDGLCVVTCGVDVHKLDAEDTTECSRGVHSEPFQIPYRCLVPEKGENLLLAGRCISGDFYPFSAYRMMGNMSAVGEAAGFAAACCVQEGIAPADFDGRRASAFMQERGFEL